jgi:hypothetical protein
MIVRGGSIWGGSPLPITDYDLVRVILVSFFSFNGCRLVTEPVLGDGIADSHRLLGFAFALESFGS